MLINRIKSFPKIIKNILRIGIGILAIGFVAYKIYQQPINQNSLYPFYNTKMFINILLLSFINWILEIYKWQTVIGTLDKISFKRASWETLNAYAVGTITPFNSGNYLRKTLFYPDQPPVKILQLNFIKGVYQMIATLLFGIFATNQITPLLLRYSVKNTLIFGFIIAVILLSIILIFKRKITDFVQLLNFKTHLILLISSILRYLCFSFLLTLLLFQYQKDIDVFTLYSNICAIYLLSSLLPVFNLLDLATKGSVAILILSPLKFTAPEILISYFVVWLTNNAIPTLVGGILQFNKS